jgi:hypothetical protein
VRATRVLATLRALVSFRPMTTSRSRDGDRCSKAPGSVPTAIQDGLGETK